MCSADRGLRRLRVPLTVAYAVYVFRCVLASPLERDAADNDGWLLGLDGEIDSQYF